MPKLTFIYHTETNRRGYCTRGHAKGKVPDIPDYSTLSTRRINRLDIKIKDTDCKQFEDKYIVVTIDSTGIEYQ